MRLLATTILLVFALRCSADPVGWTTVPNTMQDSRWAPAAVLLSDQHMALIAGGFSYVTGDCVATADRYDERADRFVPVRGRLTYPSDFCVATLLSNGAVLIAGGFNTIFGSLSTAELYDPKTDRFHLLANQMSCGRELFTATLLADGRVLIAGGFDTHRHVTQSSAEIYDPTAQTFTPTGVLLQDRFGHAAVRLADGRVLIVGGKHWRVGQPDRPLATAEIYDAKTGLFHRTRGDMFIPRDRPTANLLPDGRVLIAGGQDGTHGPTVAEVFDPRTEQFAKLSQPLHQARMAHGSADLPDGRVLLAGGWSPPIQATTASTELFDPVTSNFTLGPQLPESCHDLALIVFPDGLALAAGGKQVSDGRGSSLNSGAVWRMPAS